ncbi:MAG: VTT domain-containing protein [Gemmatimonadaceae bacterium]
MKNLFANLAKILGVLLPVVGAIVCGKLLAPYLPQFTAWVETLGVWGPVAFMAVYILGVICLMPVFLLIIAGGAIFGILKAFLFSMTSAMAGGVVAFLISRYLIRGFVYNKISTHPKLVALDRVVGEDGLKLVLLLRMSPVIPFVLSNYALGITRVKPAQFVIGTLGLAPMALSYAALGSAAGAVDVAEKSAVSMPVVVAGLTATLILGLLVARIVKRALVAAQANPAS